MKREYVVTYRGEEYRVQVERAGEELHVEHDDKHYVVRPSDSAAGGEARRAADREAGADSVAERPAASPAPGVSGTAEAAGTIRAPMTGTIKELLVAEGDTLTEGERVIIMEAMKMDIEVSAASSGTVSKILVQPGAAVRERDILIRVD